jgi:transketolase
MLGQRGVLGVTLDKLAKEDERIFVLTADLRNTSGLDRFATNFPDRFVNVGIAEQNLLGVAAGLADSGYSVFATTFANFATLRACEFVRHFMGYMRSPIKLVGFGAGFSMEFFGNTHYGIEDVSALRAIPNITIVSPADGLATLKVVQSLARHDSPAYIRLTGMSNMPTVYPADFDFTIGKAVCHRTGSDLALIACGSMVHPALVAADQLEKKGLRCTVVDMHTIKPLDVCAVDKMLDKMLIVTIEEHSTIGALGSAVAEHLSGKTGVPPLLRIGVSPGYQKAGSYAYMLEKNGLLPHQIVDTVSQRINPSTKKRRTEEQ